MPKISIFTVPDSFDPFCHTSPLGCERLLSSHVHLFVVVLQRLNVAANPNPVALMICISPKAHMMWCQWEGNYSLYKRTPSLCKWLLWKCWTFPLLFTLGNWHPSKKQVLAADQSEAICRLLRWRDLTPNTTTKTVQLLRLHSPLSSSLLNNSRAL